MGFVESLTLIFIVLKVLKVIDWSWFQVFLPCIITWIGYLIGFLTLVALGIRIPYLSRTRRTKFSKQ